MDSNFDFSPLVLYQSLKRIKKGHPKGNPMSFPTSRQQDAGYSSSTVGVHDLASLLPAYPRDGRARGKKR
jgi:hypothetical protein